MPTVRDLVETTLYLQSHKPRFCTRDMQVQNQLPTATLFVCFDLTSLLNDGACLQMWYFDQCAATQECHAVDTGHDTPPRHSVYRHRTNLSLRYPFMWNVTVKYTTTHFDVLCQTQSINLSTTFHTYQRTFTSLQDKKSIIVHLC